MRDQSKNAWATLVRVRDKARTMLKSEPENESLTEIKEAAETHMRQFNPADAETWLMEIHHFI